MHMQALMLHLTKCWRGAFLLSKELKFHSTMTSWVFSPLVLMVQFGNVCLKLTICFLVVSIWRWYQNPSKHWRNRVVSFKVDQIPQNIAPHSNSEVQIMCVWGWYTSIQFHIIFELLVLPLSNVALFPENMFMKSSDLCFYSWFEMVIMSQWKIEGSRGRWKLQVERWKLLIYLRFA